MPGVFLFNRYQSKKTIPYFRIANGRNGTVKNLYYWREHTLAF